MTNPDETRPPAAAQPRPNLAHSVKIPNMTPTSRAPEPTAAPVRRRPTMERPMRGVGQPQSIAHRDMTNHAHGLLELYKEDPSKVDPVFVQLMHLEALCTYGGEVQGLTKEIELLRKQVEQLQPLRNEDGDDAGARPSARDVRRDRRGARPRARGRRAS